MTHNGIIHVPDDPKDGRQLCQRCRCVIGTAKTGMWRPGQLVVLERYGSCVIGANDDVSQSRECKARKKGG